MAVACLFVGIVDCKALYFDHPAISGGQAEAVVDVPGLRLQCFKALSVIAVCGRRTTGDVESFLFEMLFAAVDGGAETGVRMA